MTIDVRGLPRPQGSLRLQQLPNGKQAARYPPAVYQWRAQVQQAVAERNEQPFTGPVELRIGFDLPRPQAHYGTGRNLRRVRPTAPTHPAVAPDLDKLCRAVADAITDAGLWQDDSQVCTIIAAKRYVVDLGRPGARIQVIALDKE